MSEIKNHDNGTNHENKPSSEHHEEELSYEQTSLILQHLATHTNQSDSERSSTVSFKKFCDAHKETLGEPGTKKRRLCQGNRNNWIYRGYLPSMIRNSSKYPYDSIRSASLTLLLSKKLITSKK